MKILSNLPNKMRYISFLLIFLFACQSPQKDENIKAEWALVIHGGAGNIPQESLSKEKQEAYQLKMEEALQAGSDILASGGTSLDAVEATIHVLEDSPLFNAGKGAVFNALGQNEMDASIMDGNTGLAGAIAGVRHIKNPISAARMVMDKSPHVLLVGDGAEVFASQNGIKMMDTSYFFTETRWESYEKLKKQKFGTVGCVAFDKKGNIVAGTSTGGMTLKMPGRVGDSPIIGAGTYAENSTCGISATGHGEFFIRNVVAYDISARMKYLGLSLEDASRQVIQEKLKPIGGEGGVIGIDSQGNVMMQFNTTTMFRGFVSSKDPIIKTAIFE